MTDSGNLKVIFKKIGLILNCLCFGLNFLQFRDGNVEVQTQTTAAYCRILPTLDNHV
jgi:hypothetical protein